MKKITRKPINAQEIANIVGWFRQGVKIREIAKATGRSYQAVFQIINRSDNDEMVYRNPSPRGKSEKKISFGHLTAAPFRNGDTFMPSKNDLNLGKVLMTVMNSDISGNIKMAMIAAAVENYNA